MMMGWGMGFGLMGVLMIVFWVGLILLVVLAARSLFAGGQMGGTHGSPRPTGSRRFSTSATPGVRSIERHMNS